MTAKEFLNQNGIELEKTTLIVYYDGAMRQPNLCELMEEYAIVKSGKECNHNFVAQNDTTSSVVKYKCAYCNAHKDFSHI